MLDPGEPTCPERPAPTRRKQPKQLEVGGALPAGVTPRASLGLRHKLGS